MENRDYYKETANKTITGTIEEMEEVLTALKELKSAINEENLENIKTHWSDVSEHIATGYGEHLRFGVPQVWDFVNELKIEKEEDQ